MIILLAYRRVGAGIVDKHLSRVVLPYRMNHNHRCQLLIFNFGVRRFRASLPTPFPPNCKLQIANWGEPKLAGKHFSTHSNGWGFNPLARRLARFFFISTPNLPPATYQYQTRPDESKGTFCNVLIIYSYLSFCK